MAHPPLRPKSARARVIHMRDPIGFHRFSQSAAPSPVFLHSNQ